MMFLGGVRSQIPCRVVVGVMIYLIFGNMFVMRTNLSVSIVAMAPLNATSESLNWTNYERANVLGGYYWGHVFGALMGGRIAEALGPRVTGLTSILGNVMLTYLSPAAAKHSYQLMLAVRIMLGLLGGFMYPTLHLLISRWAVPAERGKFVGALIGGTSWTFFGWLICGAVIERYGWEWSFYAFGIISNALSLLWWCLVYDSPEKHPRITIEEKTYICDGVKCTNTSAKTKPPYRRILLSVPVWSSILFEFGNSWGLYFILNVGPSYIANVHGFSISNTGYLSAVVFLARPCSAFISGSFGDYLLKSGYVSLKMLRKGGSVVSHILPAILITIIAQGLNPTASICLLILTMFLNGSVTLTCVVNAHDLTKTYAGTVTGITSCIGSIGGVLGPLLTAYLTKGDETDPEAWRSVFYVGASLYVVCAVQFMLLGSTELQPWNDVKADGSLNWTSFEKAHVLGGYYWGYMTGALFGGRIGEVVGPRLTMVLTVLGSALLTFLSPAAAQHSYQMIFVLRIALGVLGSFSYPVMHLLVSRWAVPNERGIFIGAILAGTMGMSIGWTICGLVIEPLGWEWSFYVFGIISTVWVFLWWLLVYDSPEQHPRISVEEMNYISEVIRPTSGKQRTPPYLQMLLCIPVWSQFLLHFGHTWGLYFIMTVGPTYVANALGFGLSSTGLLSASIYLAKGLSSIPIGFLGDYFLKHGWLSVKLLRKGGTIFSHIIPGIILIIVGHVSSPIVSVCLVILSMLFNGSSTVTNNANIHDLTKMFAGTVTGASSSVGAVSGILAPLVTAYFTKNDETNPDVWQPVFYVGSSLYILAALQFIVLGSTEQQAWDICEK